MTDEDLLQQIELMGDVVKNADLRSQEQISNVGKLIVDIATNETAYQIGSSASLSQDVELTEIAETVTRDRSLLNSSIEKAIIEKKIALRAEHEQRVARAQLVADIPAITE